MKLVGRLSVQAKMHFVERNWIFENFQPLHKFRSAGWNFGLARQGPLNSTWVELLRPARPVHTSVRHYLALSSLRKHQFCFYCRVTAVAVWSIVCYGCVLAVMTVAMNPECGTDIITAITHHSMPRMQQQNISRGITMMWLLRLVTGAPLVGTKREKAWNERIKYLTLTPCLFTLFT